MRCVWTTSLPLGGSRCAYMCEFGLRNNTTCLTHMVTPFLKAKCWVRQKSNETWTCTSAALMAAFINSWCQREKLRYALLMRANKPETAVQSSPSFFSWHHVVFLNEGDGTKASSSCDTEYENMHGPLVSLGWVGNYILSVHLVLDVAGQHQECLQEKQKPT